MPEYFKGIKHVDTAFTAHHIVSAAFPETGITDALQHHVLFLAVGDWYEQCDCVVAWAKHAVCRQQKALRKA